MGRRQGPKVNAYLLFMQEQRYIVRGWANKSGAELQKLCDPLWKALSKEEKAVYKEQKKSLKMTRMEQHFQARIPQEAKRVEFEGKMWRVRVARVESPELIWVVPDTSDMAVQKLMLDIEAAPLEVFQVGQLAGGDFSKDGNMYRARMLTGGTLKRRNSLASLFPLAVRVHLASVKGARNTEKNRARMEGRLSGGDIAVSLDKRGAATFFKDGHEVVFRRRGAAPSSLSTASDADERTILEEMSIDEACEGVRDRRPNDEGQLGIGEETHTLVIENQTQAEAATIPLGSCTEGTSIGIDVGNISGKDKCCTEEPGDGKLPCEETPAEEHKGTCARIEDLSEFKRKDRFKGKCDARGELASLVVETSAKKKNRKKCGSLGVKGEQGRTKSSSVKVHYSGWKIGDEVAALWEEEQVWRHGVIHEFSGNRAFVVCMLEPLVKAVMVPVGQLCSALVPLCVLNNVSAPEEENGNVPDEECNYSQVAQEVSNQEVEVGGAIDSLLLPGALICPSAGPLISAILPALSCEDAAVLGEAVCRDLSDIVLHQPATLSKLFPFIKQELANVVTSAHLVNLSKSEAGQEVLNSLLPLLTPQQLALLASSVFDLKMPELAALVGLLLPLVDDRSLTFCLLAEAIMSNYERQQPHDQDSLVDQLLKCKDNDVDARVRALMN